MDEFTVGSHELLSRSSSFSLLESLVLQELLSTNVACSGSYLWCCIGQWKAEWMVPAHNPQGVSGAGRSATRKLCFHLLRMLLPGPWCLEGLAWLFQLMTFLYILGMLASANSG